MKERIEALADTPIGGWIIYIFYLLLKRIIMPIGFIALAIFIYRGFSN